MYDETDPLALFDAWFSEAQHSEPRVANAMQLATVRADGAPRVRTVLLKGHDPSGFVFYTNLDSQKGHDLDHEPRVGLLFHWKTLERQVHVYGRASRVSPEEADAYFASRPRGSQLGAWASQQSRPLPSREVLEASVAEVTLRYQDQPVPRPPHWSGFRVAPSEIEFWQGQESRLHDRVVFLRQSLEGAWARELRYP